MIPSLYNYQDYLNLFFFYFDPNATHMDQKPQFSLITDTIKLLPYFTINQNGCFVEVLEERSFKDNAFSNILVLDMIQNPFIDNVVQSNLMDHHLLYMVNSYEKNNHYLNTRKELDSGFFNKFNYKSIFSTSSAPYYKAYTNQTQFDLINDNFANNIHQYLSLFKRAFEHIEDINALEKHLDSQLSTIFHSFSHLLNTDFNFKTHSNLSKQILQGFNINRDLLNKIFNDLDVVHSPIFDKLHEGYHVVQEYTDNQINNLKEAEKRLASYPEGHELFYSDLTLFLEIGASLIIKSEELLNNKNLFSLTEKKFVLDFLENSKFLLFQTDFYCLKLFSELISPIEPDHYDLNEEKKMFVNKYSQSIQKIEKLYNQYDVSLFNNKNYLNQISLKEILPTVLEEIDNILLSCDTFYSFTLEEPDLSQFKDTFKNNLFISLCQNKVTPDIYQDLHLNYNAINREVMLTKKLSTNNALNKPRYKI